MSVFHHMGVVITIPDEEKPEALLQLGDASYSVRAAEGTGYDDFRMLCERRAGQLQQIVNQIAGADNGVKQAEAAHEELLRQAQLRVDQAEAAAATLRRHLAAVTDAWAAA